MLIHISKRVITRRYPFTNVTVQKNYLSFLGWNPQKDTFFKGKKWLWLLDPEFSFCCKKEIIGGYHCIVRKHQNPRKKTIFKLYLSSCLHSLKLPYRFGSAQYFLMRDIQFICTHTFQCFHKTLLRSHFLPIFYLFLPLKAVIFIYN